ncbi:DUF1566 domain-containing protein [Patescibacteria group bacterium AH-259-L05]|nr:DUF1566 domain-containing protein [Patescibacteria group bacterium AH-259-L05]
MRKQGFEIIKGGLTVLLAVFILFTVAKAGIFSPPSEPGPTMRPLSDLPTATEIWDSATRTLTSFGTLVTDIWNKAVSSLTDTTTIGGFIVDELGKLDEPISSRSTLSQSDILSDVTPFKGADISSILTNTSDIEGILSGTDYVSGVSADASGNVLEQLEFIMQNLGGYTYGSSDASHVLTVANGTYDATNLTASNVKSDVSFGVGLTGSYTGAGTWTYGSNDASKVLNTADAAGTWYPASAAEVISTATFGVKDGTSGTYDVSNVSAENIKYGVSIGGVTGTFPSDGTALVSEVKTGKTFYTSSSTKLTGTMLTQTLSDTSDTINAGYYEATTLSAEDLDLAAGNIKNGVTIFGLTGDYPSATYPLPGDTVVDDATASEIKNGFEAWTKAGSLLTGTMPIQTLSATSDTVNAGYYDATTLSDVDADLITSNIKSGITIFGVSGDSNVVDTSSGDAVAGYILSGKIAWVDGVAITGTALVNLFAGTGQGITGGSQANGGVDDYNNGGSAPSDRYVKTWTDCTTGDNCGTSDSNADAKDDSTGLIWSKPCAGSGTTCTPTDEASPTKYTWSNAVSACANMTGWSLPHQKQFMQAYVDGSYGNLEDAGVKRVYWLTTARSWNTSFAWKGHLSRGTTNTGDKTATHYVRCVR